MFLIYPNVLSAVEYEETTQKTFKYNINNFKVDEENIIINGWATTYHHQDLTGNDTHEYSLELTNRTTEEKLIYVATLLNVDKTRLMRAGEDTKHCTSYFVTSGCHYSFTYAGFEFKIPLSDLSIDTDYDIKLRVYEKLVDRRYQISIYALGIDDTYEANGIRYQLYSDINKTSITFTDSNIFVRSGPGQNYSIKSSNKSCSGNGKNLFWYPKGHFTNVVGARQTNPGFADSELWINLGYNYGNCVSGKARAVDGNTYNGWAPWVYMLGSGDPAIIKVMSLNTVSIEELRAYTVEKNKKTKILLTLSSGESQDIEIKAYHNDVLMYDENKRINGTNTYKIEYVIPSEGTLKIDVIDKYTTHSISSKIYVASKQEYDIDLSNKSGIIEVENPILVITDKNRNAVEYKETIQLSSVPYEIDLSQGRGITGVTSAITYWYPLEEFSLNSDYSIYALYPTQEDTLNYETVDNKVKVNLIKDDVVRNDEYDISYFHHPDMLLSLINGNLYKEEESDHDFYNGGSIWYPSWNDDIGTYDYEYIGSNLGVNKITIKRNLEYSITSTMFGEETGIFIIKRVKNPDNSNLVYKKSFTYDELMENK